MKPSKLSVAYAEDHLAVRKGIINCLEADGVIEVTIEGNNGVELLEQMLSTVKPPDVCLIDINMPKMDGFMLIKEIKARWPRMGCLILTAFEHESYIIDMIKAGANGYLLKSCDPAEIVQAIHTIYLDGYYYSEVASSASYNFVQSKKLKSISLSDREIELLRNVCNEMSYADIAVLMKTTYRTVDGLRERLCAKLGVSSRIGLVLASIKMGYYKVESAHIHTNKQNQASS